MDKQALKKPQVIVEEVISEETDTKIQTRSAVWNQRINLELTRRKMIKTEKQVVKNGENTRKIEIDEDTDRSLVSYPSPGKIYRQEADRVKTEISSEKKPSEGEVSVQRPKLFIVKVNLRQPEPREKQVVEVKTMEEDLAPTLSSVDADEEIQHQIFGVGEVEGFSFEVESGEVSTVRDGESENTAYRIENPDYEVDEAENFSPPDSPVDKPYTPNLKVEKVYPSRVEPEPEISEDGYDRFSPLLEDFGDLEGSESLGGAVFTAEYGIDSEVSERLVIDLDSMFPYLDSVSGSEAVETLWDEYGVEATVAEVPYFSENSGASWEDGWNSYDMVLQMNGMNVLDTEYLSGELHQVGDLREPVQDSIDSGFSTDQVIEFRESSEFSNHTGGYEASERTEEAWVEKYGEEILELEGIERGVYAAFQEDVGFRGAHMEPAETDLLSDSAVKML